MSEWDVYRDALERAQGRLEQAMGALETGADELDREAEHIDDSGLAEDLDRLAEVFEQLDRLAAALHDQVERAAAGRPVGFELVDRARLEDDEVDE